MGHYPIGEGPFVEIPGITFPDTLQGFGVGQGNPPLSDPERAPCRGEGFEPGREDLPRFPGVLVERHRRTVPHRHGDRMSFPGMGHRWRQVLPQGTTPHPGGELGPRRRGPGNGDGSPAVGRHGPPPLSPHHVQRQTSGAGTAGVEPLEAAVLPHQGEGVAADAVGGGLHHRESRRSGHRRIHGVAPAF